MFEEDIFGWYFFCCCENFDFGEYLDLLYGGEVCWDFVVFWVGLAGDEYNEVFFLCFYNNLLLLFYVFGIFVLFVEGLDFVNFSIVYWLVVDGFVDLVSENVVFENN